MKYSISLSLTLGVITLLGLPSCQINSSYQTQIQSQQEIKITGSGTAYKPLKVLSAVYQNQESSLRVTFLPSSQSSGGIAGAKQGLVNLGAVTRPPKESEDNGNLVYQEMAQDALVVATHLSVKGVTNLSTEQLQAIYSGQITNWQVLGGPDANIILLDRPEDESAKRLLRQHYLGTELENAPDAVIMRHESDLIKAVQSTPYSIGTFSLANAITNKLPVNRLSLNNVKPTSTNVEAGKYPMVRHLGIVYQSQPSKATQDLIDFAFSQEGANHLRNSGFVPASQE